MDVSLLPLLALPLGAFVILLCMPARLSLVMYRFSVSMVVLQFIYTLYLVLGVLESSALWHYSLIVPWIKRFDIFFALSMDGLSALMCMLSAVVFLIAMLISHHINRRPKAYFALCFLLLFGVTGVFLAHDLFLFYIFWEVTLIPLYFLIGIWGGARREYAAIKFFIYTMVGSVFLLLCLILLYQAKITPAEGILFKDFLIHQQWIGSLETTVLGKTFSSIIFLGFFIVFAVKIPVFPFHTWLPDAHVQAPTPISVLLAGIILKLGVYGLIRLGLGLVPIQVAYFAPILLVLGLINLIYGAFCAMYQTNAKRMIAYASISHMGYCMIGIATLNMLGLQGSVLQMLSHGLISVMLFLVVGFIYKQTRSLDIEDLGGLAHQLPKLGFVAVFAIFASMGLPGLFGFVSEIITLSGAWVAEPKSILLGGTTRVLFQVGTLFGVTGMLITAVYMLWMLQSVFFGPSRQRWSGLKDLDQAYIMAFAILIIPIVYFGIAPSSLLDLIHQSFLSEIDWIAPKVLR